MKKVSSADIPVICSGLILSLVQELVKFKLELALWIVQKYHQHPQLNRPKVATYLFDTINMWNLNSCLAGLQEQANKAYHLLKPCLHPFKKRQTWSDVLCRMTTTFQPSIRIEVLHRLGTIVLYNLSIFNSNCLPGLVLNLSSMLRSSAIRCTCASKPYILEIYLDNFKQTKQWQFSSSGKMQL